VNVATWYTTLTGMTPAEQAACGPPADAHWACLFVFRRTGNDVAARAAETFVATPLTIVVIVVGAFLLDRLLRRGINRFVAHMEEEIHERVATVRARAAGHVVPFAETRRLQRLHAIGGLLRGAVRFLVWLGAVLLVLVELGVALGPVLTGAGLIGLALGFGAQNIVRDILAGVSTLIEDQYGVGDWIDVEGAVGMVERVGLRTTRMRDLDGVVWHIPNGAMSRVGNLSQEWARATLDVPIALDADPGTAKELIKAVADELWNDPDWAWRIISEPEVWGVQQLEPEGMAIRLVLETRPIENWSVLRELRERLKLALDEAGIALPQPQRVIWMREEQVAGGDGERPRAGSRTPR
jgi:moderate conductance mechanosensitive channel